MVLVRSHCNGGEKACRDWGGRERDKTTYGGILSLALLLLLLLLLLGLLLFLFLLLLLLLWLLVRGLS